MKIRGIALSLLALLCLFMSAPANASSGASGGKQVAYEDGKLLFDAGFYDLARENFIAASGYLDANLYTRFIDAVNSIGQGRFDSAISYLSTLGEFENAHIWMAYARGRYLESKDDIFSALDEYYLASQALKLETLEGFPEEELYAHYDDLTHVSAIVPEIIAISGDASAVSLSIRCDYKASCYYIYVSDAIDGVYDTLGIARANEVTLKIKESMAGKKLYFKVSAGYEARGTIRPDVWQILNAWHENMSAGRMLVGIVSPKSRAREVSTLRPVDAPVLTGADVVRDSVKLAWSLVSGADSYNVYRKAGGAEYSLIGSANLCLFDDNNYVSGNTYSYQVTAVRDGVESGRSNALEARVGLHAPSITSLESRDGNVYIRWEAVKEADKFDVYRGSRLNGVFEPIDTTTTNGCTDTRVDQGATYYYYVVAYVGKNQSDPSATKSIEVPLQLSAPLADAVTQAGNSVYLSWERVKNAEEYIVYRTQSSSGEGVEVKRTSGTSFTDIGLRAGIYYYRVQAVSGVYSSERSQRVSARIGLDAPRLFAERQLDSVALSWSRVDGVEYYDLYRASDNGYYGSVIKNTTDLSYTDWAVTPGGKYTYWVVACAGGVESDDSNRESVAMALPIIDYKGKLVANASSIRANNNPPVGPEMLIDGNIGTSWDSHATGAGSWVTITPADGDIYRFSGFSIYNGKNLVKGENPATKRTDTFWHKNCRVKDCTIYIDDQLAGRYCLSDIRGEQTFLFDTPLLGTQFKLVIDSVYNKHSIWKDTCIMEIVLK